MLKDQIDARQTLAISALQASGLFPDGLGLEASDASSGSENESLSDLKNRKTSGIGEEDDDDDDDGVPHKYQKKGKTRVIVEDDDDDGDDGDDGGGDGGGDDDGGDDDDDGDERAYIRMKAPLVVVHDAIRGILGQRMIQQIPLLGKS